MAIARMSHLRLVGLRSQENKIVDILTKRGLFEVRAAESMSSELEKSDMAAADALKLKQSNISFALDFIKQRHGEMQKILAADAMSSAPRYDYALPERKFPAGKTLITHEQFDEARAEEYDLLGVCDELKKLSFELVEVRSRINALEAQKKQYLPYAALPIAFSVQRRTSGVNICIYMSRGDVSPDVLDGLVCAYEKIDMMYVVVVRAADISELEKRMSAAGLERCPFDDDCTAAQKLEDIAKERTALDDRIYELTKQALDSEKYYDELRILYDVFELGIERAEADTLLLKTDSTFVLEGWLPEAVANSTVEQVRAACPKTFIQLLAPEERDAPPTLCVNNKLVQPYEDVTNMYTAPKYGEIDPNPIMSIFYFVFFGIMVGDAVYGLVLAVIGLILGYSDKFSTGVKRLLQLVGWGGISAVIWGVVFGGYLSIDFGVDISLWFNPMDEPLTLLILSIVLGCVQLIAAYIMNLVSQCKNGDPVSGILDNVPIIILFVALAFVGLNFVLADPPSWMTVVAIVLAAIGGGMLLIFGGHSSDSIVGKVIGGFGALYGLINIMSDILSYCRLFGLCLASAAIAMAFNTLGGIIFAIPVAGYPIGIILLVALHAFNLALGVLSAYVHDARLQYLEFYGKFYAGEGRLFSPLGMRTKNTRFASN